MDEQLSVETIRQDLALATVQGRGEYFRSYEDGVGYVWLGEDVFELREQKDVLRLLFQNSEELLIPGVPDADTIIGAYRDSIIDDDLIFRSRRAAVNATKSRVRKAIAGSDTYK